MSTAASPDRRRQRCPLCGRPARADHHPFCGRGCRDRDLLNWLGDGYRMPGPPADDPPPEKDQERLDSQGRALL